MKMIEHAIEENHYFPLTKAQERFWAHEVLEEMPGLYNLPMVWRLDGELDRDRFASAFDNVVNRHAIMRMTFHLSDNGPLQRVKPRQTGWLHIEEKNTFPDHASFDKTETDFSIDEYFKGFVDPPLDLETGPAFRAHLVVVSACEHYFLFMPHHLVWDASSTDILIREISTVYEGGDSFTEEEISYSQQFNQLNSESRPGLDTDIRYFVENLQGCVNSVDLPYDKRRPSHYDFSGSVEPVNIGPETFQQVNQLASDVRATPYMVCLSLWRVFLARLSDSYDYIVSTPMDLRTDKRVHNTIGCFVNPAYLRSQIHIGGNIKEDIESVRKEIINALPHANASVEEILNGLNVSRDASRPPLAQVMFSFISHEVDRYNFGRVHVSPVAIPQHKAMAELHLVVEESVDDLNLSLIYATSLFSSKQAKTITRAFWVFIREVLANPTGILSSFPLIDDDTLSTQYTRNREFERSFDDPKRIDQMIMAKATTHYNKTAIVSNNEEVSYAELEDRVQTIVQRLVLNDVNASDIIGVMLGRGIDMIASVLAIWRVGATYLPLDPTYPSSRLQYIVADSRTRFLLTDSTTTELLQNDNFSEINLDGVQSAEKNNGEPDIGATDLTSALSRPFVANERAYVIYTSGSTGRPKGVENAHGPLFNFISSMGERPGFTKDDTLLAVTTAAFDISLLEMFLPLTFGGTVVLADHEDVPDPFSLMEVMDRFQPTIMQATPSTWRLLLDGDWKGNTSLTVLCGGEQLPGALATLLKPKVKALWNMYGPTETTVWSTCKRITDPQHISVGTPIANTSLFVADRFGKMLPDGIVGELLIGGAGVALGYLDRDALTAERFVNACSRQGSVRLYRTGDLARRRADGDYEILGRLDDQVKVRGHRIELGEIEKSLDQLPTVEKAIAAVRKDASGEPTLVAFIKCINGEQLVSSALRRSLKKELPAYMLPQMFFEIDDIPTTHNGKINRGALPEIATREQQETERIPPRTDIERAIAEIWRELLPVNAISVKDNFFELGGQSLQAARMAAILQNRTGYRISPRKIIFETLEQLASATEAS
ncbi:MAG: amino acid adenylation domain-containing protein [Pseudomonadota bacterium]